MILNDRRDRQYMFTVEEEGVFESHVGNLKHSDITGSKEGTWFRTSKESWVIVFRPTKYDLSLNMPRIATIVYPKDMGAIITYSNIRPGNKVVEAGSGSGSLTIALSDAVGESGNIYSYDIREDMSHLATTNVHKYACSPFNVTFKLGNITENIDESEVDCVALDIPEPWSALDNIRPALRYWAGGPIVFFTNYNAG